MKLPPNMTSRSWTAKRTGLRITAYYHRSSLAEGRKLTPLGTDYAEALRLWAIKEGSRIEKPRAGSLADIYEKHMQWAENLKISKLGQRTVDDRKYYWGKSDSGRLCTVFGKVCIDDLLPEHMLEYFETRSSQKGAKKELKFLSVMCNWAKSRGLMSAENPTNNIMRLMKTGGGREIYVEDSWLDLVLKNSTQLIRDALNFTYYCANRPDETAMAMFSHVDHDELVVRLSKTEKSGNKEKRIPIAGDLKLFIESQKRRKIRSAYLVSDERGQRLKPNAAKFKKQFKQARDLAEKESQLLGVEFVRFQFRDIRAKAGTDIARDYGIEAARLALGHTTQKQTQEYIRSVKGASAQARKRKIGKVV